MDKTLAIGPCEAKLSLYRILFRPSYCEHSNCPHSVLFISVGIKETYQCSLPFIQIFLWLYWCERKAYQGCLYGGVEWTEKALNDAICRATWLFFLDCVHPFRDLTALLRDWDAIPKWRCFLFFSAKQPNFSCQRHVHFM